MNLAHLFPRFATCLTVVGGLAIAGPAFAQSTFVGPNLTDVQAEPLKSPVGSLNALLTAFPAKAELETLRGQALVVFPDERNPSTSVKLTDDGQNGDRVAGDGIFSGMGPFDFDSFISRTNSRVDAVVSAKGSPVTWSFSDRLRTEGREITKIDPASVVAGRPVSVKPFGFSSVINFPNSLVINHTSVVRDPSRTFSPCLGGTPMGKWTFGYLMTEMANQPLTGITPSDFARRWLMSWKFPNTINFWTVPARASAINTIIANWEAASGVGPGGALDLSQAPFRLVAVVNRMDLHGSIGYSSGSAGETRFVFAYEDSSCNPQEFMVIFEYGNNQRTCSTIKTLAQQWVNLTGLTVGSSTYNTALEAITEQVAKRNAAPAKPNGSAINQVRTNEIFLGSVWELREFKVFASGAAPNFLTEDTVKRAPDNTLNNSATLTNCIQSHLPSVWPNPPASPTNILTGSFDPLECPSGTPFRGGANTIPFPSTTFCFKAPGLVGNGAISASDARFQYSVNTCSGCHGGDTQLSSTRFTHIGPTGSLSPFLATAYSKADCVATSTARFFDEPTRRSQDLDALANSTCFSMVSLPMLSASAVH